MFQPSLRLSLCNTFCVDIDAFILIGGRSSRFGHDKSTVMIEGKTLVERTAESVSKAIPSARITLVAGSDEQITTLFSTKKSFPFIFDLYPGRGAYGGVHAALAHAKAEWALIVACDLPLITAELIDRLASFIGEEFDGVVPVQPDGEVQPLCALYRRTTCLAVAEEPLLRNRSTPPVKAIFDKVRTRFVRFEELADLPGSENFFLNMNTSEDQQKAEQILTTNKTNRTN